MDLMRVAYGEDRIVGKKFPQEEHIENAQKKHENETDLQYEMRMYTFNRMSEKRDLDKALNHSKDMNPNGFWEMLYTVQGCHYRFFDLDRLDKLKEEKTKSFCKIVSQGLVQSDPQYIDKVIFMIRHPRSVAKSQEKLVRPSPLGDLSKMKIDGEQIKIHTPEMFINVTSTVSHWLLRFNTVPVHYVIYDDLLENPEKVLSGISDFLGEDGNNKDAAKQINKKLRRSYPEEVENDLWGDAEFIYKQFVKKDYKSIVDFSKRQDTATFNNNLNFFCFRSGNGVRPQFCKMCRKNEPKIIQKQRNQAESKKIKWEDEPCMYECAYIHGYKKLSVNESIDNNFWKDGIEPINIAEEVVVEQGEKTMAEDTVFRQSEIKIVLDNLDIFKYEYPDVRKRDWDNFVAKKGGCSCTKKIIDGFKRDIDKTNSIFSKLMGKEVSMYFAGPIQDPVVKEFDSIQDVEAFLKKLKNQGKQIKSATPAPNGKGGYILVVL